MTDWMIWFAVACGLVGLEMATGTFYLLMIAIGVAAGGVAALTGADGTMQCIIAALVAAAATFALRRSHVGHADKVDSTRDDSVNLDIGQTLEVYAWRSIPGAASTARVMYRGAQWDVELAPGSQPVPGMFEIQEVQGNRLIVINRRLVGHVQ